MSAENTADTRPKQRGERTDSSMKRLPGGKGGVPGPRWAPTP